MDQYSLITTTCAIRIILYHAHRVNCHLLYIFNLLIQFTTYPFNLQIKLINKINYFK